MADGFVRYTHLFFLLPAFFLAHRGAAEIERYSLAGTVLDPKGSVVQNITVPVANDVLHDVHRIAVGPLERLSPCTFHSTISNQENFVATCDEAFGENAIGHRALDGRSSLH